MDDYKKCLQANTGPGGLFCACCGPPRSNTSRGRKGARKLRRKWTKVARNRFKRQAKEILEMEEGQEK